MSTLPRIYLTAICNTSRTEAITKTEAIIQQYGTILDFSLFSDVSLALVVEIHGQNIPIIMHALDSTLLFNDNTEPIQQINYHVFLNITFTLGTGNMKHRIPEVPG